MPRFIHKIDRRKILRTVIVLTGSAFLVFITFFSASCDEVKRHEILTFFFDGVPPIGYEDSDRDLFSDKAGMQDKQIENEVVWYAHKARKQCDSCHLKSKSSQWAVPEFVAEVPQLCYQCHDDTTAADNYVHGPVAVGQCLLCHDPHRAKNKQLLKKPQPELCFQCHNNVQVGKIPGHADDMEGTCTKCHDPHSSSVKAMLKVDPERDVQ